MRRERKLALPVLALVLSAMAVSEAYPQALPPAFTGMALISTLPAIASASLQFTNLPTSYNTLFLNCSGLIVSGATTIIQLQVGEGAGPTWETGLHYTLARNFVGSDGSSGSSGGTTASDLLGNGANTSTTVPMSLKAYFDNVGSSSVYKMVTTTSGIPNDTPILYSETTMGYWNNDTNAIAGIQVAASTGNIASGTCSLYGMN